MATASTSPRDEALADADGVFVCRKSAKARNRGKWGTVGGAALWEFSRGVRLGGVGQNARPNRFTSQEGGVGDGLTSAAGVAEQGRRGNCGPIYRPAVSGECAGREPARGEHHWAGGSALTAS